MALEPALEPALESAAESAAGRKSDRGRRRSSESLSEWGAVRDGEFVDLWHVPPVLTSDGATADAPLDFHGDTI